MVKGSHDIDDDDNVNNCIDDNINDNDDKKKSRFRLVNFFCVNELRLLGFQTKERFIYSRIKVVVLTGFPCNKIDDNDADKNHSRVNEDKSIDSNDDNDNSKKIRRNRLKLMKITTKTKIMTMMIMMTIATTKTMKLTTTTTNN